MRQKNLPAATLSSSFNPIPHDCSRVILPSRPSTRPSDLVIVEHSRAPNRGRQEYRELVSEGRCKLTVALRRGHARVVQNGGVLHDGPIFPGMARLSQPGDRIEGEVFTAMEAVIISLPLEQISERLPAQQSIRQLRPILEPNTQAEQLGRLLLDVPRFDRRYSGLFGEGLIDGLLAIMFDRSEREPAECRAKGAFEASEFRRVLDFAEERIGQPLGLAEWSKAFDMPAQEFSRRFRLTTSSAPYAYFLRRRVERAKETMTNTKASLVDIALDVGFSSQSHFTEAFRRIVGVSPGLWRREQGLECEFEQSNVSLSRR